MDDEEEDPEDGAHVGGCGFERGRRGAELEFIGGVEEGGENIEDRVRQMQDYDDERIVEHELSLQLLRNYASSVRHQQFRDTDIITVRVEQPGE